jgi:hypothetical protein
MRSRVAAQIQAARQVLRAGGQFAPTLIIAPGAGLPPRDRSSRNRNEQHRDTRIVAGHAPIGRYTRPRIAVPAARTAVSLDLIATNTAQHAAIRENQRPLQKLIRIFSALNQYQSPGGC